MPIEEESVGIIDLVVVMSTSVVGSVEISLTVTLLTILGVTVLVAVILLATEDSIDVVGEGCILILDPIILTGILVAVDNNTKL